MASGREERREKVAAGAGKTGEKAGCLEAWREFLFSDALGDPFLPLQEIASKCLSLIAACGLPLAGKKDAELASGWIWDRSQGRRSPSRLVDHISI